MDTIQLQPPNPFDFKHLDDWQTWKHRLEQYCHASGLATQNKQRQVSALLHCFEKQADTVLSSTSISEDNRKKYSEVMSKFDEYFKVQKNSIFARARFNRRNPLPGKRQKNISQFCLTLSILATTENSEMKCYLID